MRSSRRRRPSCCGSPATDPRVELHAADGVDALGRIGAVDLVLLDGDPNWSTTHAELDVVVARSREAGVPAPVIVVHNVHWPFGRRDGYHAADRPAAPLRRPSARGRADARPVAARRRRRAARAVRGARRGRRAQRRADRGRGLPRRRSRPMGARRPAGLRRHRGAGRHGAPARTTRSCAPCSRRCARPTRCGVPGGARRPAASTPSCGRSRRRPTARASTCCAPPQRRLERELATARAELAAARPSGAPGASPELLAAQLAALGDERDRLREEVRELLEHRAANLAGRRQLERLEAALAQHERSAAQVAAERDEQGARGRRAARAPGARPGRARARAAGRSRRRPARSPRAGAASTSRRAASPSWATPSAC